MVNKLLDAVNARYKLKEKDTGSFAALKAQGMKFTIRSFEAEGLGTVSAMQAAGFFGLMKMDTVIINPTEIDMPLLSYDRVHAMGNDTLIYEIYDTFVEKRSLKRAEGVKTAYSALPEHDLGEHWYDDIKLPVSVSKKAKGKAAEKFDELAAMYLTAYLKDCADAPACDAAKKKEKASVYVEGLLSNGGPSTDVFKKAIGDEKTAELFRTVLFGTK